MSFYQSLNDKIFLLEKHIKERKEKERISPLLLTYAPDMKPVHSFSLADSWEYLKLSFYKFLLVLTQLYLVIKGAPVSNFNVFTKAGRDGIYICNYSYCHYKGYHKNTKWRSVSMIIAATIIVSLFVSLVFPGKPRAMAAIFSWTQVNWSGTPDAIPAIHATDQIGWIKYAIGASLSIIGSVSDIKLNLTNAAAAPWLQTNWITGADTGSTAAHATDRNATWTKFYSKEDIYISADTAGELKLTSIPGTYTETSDADFNTGNYGAPVTMSDGAGGVKLILPPGVPIGLGATAGNAQVVLSWSAPASNGGSAVTSYKVYQGTTSGGETLLTSGGCSGLGNVLTCTQASLTNGTTYYYKVSAVNAIGEGSQSSEANATPQCTIVIGTQTWMCYNLNVGTMLTGSTAQTNNSVLEKNCYNHSEANCTSDGGLYTWNEAMGYITTEGAQGICPSGFHIPSDAEWYTLENGLKDGANSCVSTRNGLDCDTAGTKLKTGGSSGFAGILTGWRMATSTFFEQGTNAYYWSSTVLDTSNAWARGLSSSTSTVNRLTNWRNYPNPVRCLKN